jgi:hypothetical protein
MKKYGVLIVSVALFLMVLPLSKRMTFPQNDEWVYYEMVERFMEGDFTLHPYSGPTFYTQGLIAAGYSKVFSMERLPFLTLFFSVLNFYILTMFLIKRLKKTTGISILLGLVYFFSPFNIYLSLGFMTAIYFMPFLLLCLWWLSLFEETGDYKYYRLLLFTAFIGFLGRQLAMFIPLGVGFYYGCKKDWKSASLGVGFFVALFLYYLKVFPLSPRMIDIPSQWHHLKDFDYTLAIVYGVLIIVTAFLFPVFLSSFNVKEVVKKKKKLLLLVLIAVASYFLLDKYFNPHEVSWGEFPYFENIFERTGYYPRGVDGRKYQFKWNYDLYYYWDLFSKILLVTFVGYVIAFKKKVINEYSALAAVYIAILVVAETFYDRYIFLLLPLTVLYLAKDFLHENKITRLFLSGFVFFSALFAYQLANDFVSINEYVWHRAEEIAVMENIDRKYILGTNAWKMTYRNGKRDYIYNFSYDSQEVNEGYACCYDVVEVKDIQFPASIFVNPKVYLYKIK